MHLKQRIYASLSATVNATLFTFLCYGPLPAASNESKSLPCQGGRALAQPSERSTAAETAGQQTHGSTIKASKGGFSPGDYRIDLAVNGGPAQSLPFTVVPLLPPVVLAEQAKVPRGFNIALAALGGKGEAATSEYDDKTWAAANGIDGTVSIREGGWSSKDHTLPQDLLFSFYQTREALIAAVVIDTTTPETVKQLANIPKHVEIWTSTTGPVDGFSKILAPASSDALPSK
jgi:hypothetical protein